MRSPVNRHRLWQLVVDAVKAGDIAVYRNLGLIPCQVQDGKLVNLFDNPLRP